MIRTDIAVLFVGDEAEKQALLLGEPDAVLHHPGLRRAGRWSCCGWTRSDVERLAELVTDAWRMRAPHSLVGDLAPTDEARRA